LPSDVNRRTRTILEEGPMKIKDLIVFVDAVGLLGKDFW
jgi:hypothetical protein